jgi:hypothetical protein
LERLAEQHLDLGIYASEIACRRPFERCPEGRLDP